LIEKSFTLPCTMYMPVTDRSHYYMDLTLMSAVAAAQAKPPWSATPPVDHCITVPQACALVALWLPRAVWVWYVR